jgi:hypothetical protein
VRSILSKDITAKHLVKKIGDLVEIAKDDEPQGDKEKS